MHREPGGAKSPIGHFYSTPKQSRSGWYLAMMILFLCADLPAGNITIVGTVRDRKRGTTVSSALIKIVDQSGATLGTTTTDAQGQWRVVVPLTGVDSYTGVPQTFAIDQNYPNPFNPSTKIPFSTRVKGTVRITIHNILGQLVDAKELELQPGTYAIDWRSKGSAGVLFYSIETENVRLTKKMVQLDRGNGGGLGGVSLVAPHASYSLLLPQLSDSCRVITSSLVYETDTVMVALRDSARADILLETIHDRAFLFDLHNDVVEQIVAAGFNYQIGDRHTVPQVKQHTDIPRLRDGGVDAQVFSIWVSPSDSLPSYFSRTMRYLDTLNAQAARNSAEIGLAKSVGAFDAMARQGKIAGIVVVEGGHSIDGKLENLLTLYQSGARMMTITWNNSTTWAVAAADSRTDQVGLSDFGKQVIRTMDSLGMIIDVSHVGRKTIDDIRDISKNPIIASHSGANTLRSHSRNLTDTQIRAIALRGGVVGVTFYPPHLTSGTASLETVLQHIDYIKNLVGVDYVALGSDFDGIERWPVGLEDVTRFPSITAALLQRGYSREDVRKILGENFMRVYRAVCK